MSLKRGIDKAVTTVIEELKSLSKPDEGAAGDRAGRHHLRQQRLTIGEILAEAMSKVGKEGVITVEEARASTRSSRSSRACSSTAAT
jgi:chaperonin GroEL